MKKLFEYGELLEYLCRIGLSGSNKTPIGVRQMQICEIADGIVSAAGSFPFQIRAHELRTEAGFYPFLCHFEIRADNGRRRVVRPANLVR